MELTSINDLFQEIDYLKKKAALADEILRFYDKGTMTFVIPTEWKNLGNLARDKWNTIPKSPRHDLNEKIYNLLPHRESERLVNFEELSKTAAD